MKEVAIVNRSTGAEVGDRIGCADTSLTRLLGLLGKKSLQAGRGIWINPSSGVHTIGMRFTIDVIGLDRKMRIVKLWPYVRPFRVTSINLQVKSVIEMAAGQIQAHSLQLGHTLQTLPWD